MKIFKLTLIFQILFLINTTNVYTKDHKSLIEDEKNTINIFKSNVHSVVNVSSIQTKRNIWYYGDIDVPAGQGSGIVWNKKGYIVTNFHVVQGGNKFQISFHNDQNQYEAQVIGVEPNKDIAVLKLLKTPKKFKPVTIGSSKDLEVGQKTVAIGNPFGLDNTLTQGIVSALERKIEGVGGVKIQGMIQTDASINPGNSGGPLLDSSGKLIGMNTVIYSSSGSSSGVGFAVPIDTIKRIVPQLIKHGKVIRPGLLIGILPEHAKRRFGITKGIAITYIEEGGPADKAGLQGMTRDRRGRYYLGDIITKVDGKEVNSFDDIYQVLDKKSIGDTVEVEFIRDDKLSKVQVTLSDISKVKY